MDARVAVTSWVLVRGDNSGYLFCNIVGKENLRIVHDEPWLKGTYISLMRNRLQLTGIPPVQSKNVTGHSGRRSGVQHLRYLGVKDKGIMEWFGMETAHRYTELCNQNEEIVVPDFTSKQALISHAEAATGTASVHKEKYPVMLTSGNLISVKATAS